MEKYCRAGQATDDNMVHVPHMLDTKGYKHTHTHRICNTYCFPLQQWLHKCTTLLRYMHTACLV